MDLLKQARRGNPKEIRNFLQHFAPFVAVNDDFTMLLILRTFQVSIFNKQSIILNSCAIDENFQWGITVVKSAIDGGAQHNVYIPNEKKYLGIKIQNDTIEILTDGLVVPTNEAELTRKLFFLNDDSPKGITTAFEKLNNEHYSEETRADFIGDQIITIPTIGELIYDEKFDWYEGKLIDKYPIVVYIHFTTPEKLQTVIEFANSQLQSKFYNQMLLEMESEMIELKNAEWLDDTEEKEQPVTIEEFRKRVTIESIAFNDDCSTLIYCNDGDLFFGHTILIDIDENGKYKAADLVG